MSPNDLVRFMYWSDTCADFARVDLIHLRLRAESWNDRCSVTGLLLYDGARFAQMIEGPASEVRHIIERIEADPRHVIRHVPQHKACADRQFQGWALKFIQRRATDPVGAFRFDAQDALSHTTDPAVRDFFVRFAEAAE